MHHLHHFFKKFPVGAPRSPTWRRGISTSASIQLRVKNYPASRISERSFEDKNYTQILGKNQHAIGKKLSQNAPFASIFLKISRGRPPGPPPAGGGYPLPHPPPAALRADLVTPTGSGPSGSATASSATVANIVF